jgi:hypothetical protein
MHAWMHRKGRRFDVFLQDDMDPTPRNGRPSRRSGLLLLLMLCSYDLADDTVPVSHCLHCILFNYYIMILQQGLGQWGERLLPLVPTHGVQWRTSRSIRSSAKHDAPIRQ